MKEKIKLLLILSVVVLTSNLQGSDEEQHRYKNEITYVEQEEFNEGSREYEDAVNSYNQGEYKASKKKFKEVIKKYSGTKWAYSARLYIARCWNKIGNHKKSVEELQSIMEEPDRNKFIPAGVIIEELGKVKNILALDKLKDLLKNSKIKDIRKKSAEVIGKVTGKIDLKEINKHVDFMVEALRLEPEMEVAREISRSIYKMGRVNSDKLIKMYKNADGFLKKKLLLLISKYDDEDLIMAMQEESEKARGIIMNYVSWALAKMDPYRFARLYRGKLKKEEDKYILHGNDFKVELFKPSLKRQEIDEFESLIGKKVTVYGVEVEGGVIYTDFFKSK